MWGGASFCEQARPRLSLFLCSTRLAAASLPSNGDCSRTLSHTRQNITVRIPSLLHKKNQTHTPFPNPLSFSLGAPGPVLQLVHRFLGLVRGFAVGGFGEGFGLCGGRVERSATVGVPRCLPCCRSVLGLLHRDAPPSTPPPYTTRSTSPMCATRDRRPAERGAHAENTTNGNTTRLSARLFVHVDQAEGFIALGAGRVDGVAVVVGHGGGGVFVAGGSCVRQKTAAIECSRFLFVCFTSLSPPVRL